MTRIPHGLVLDAVQRKPRCHALVGDDDLLAAVSRPGQQLGGKLLRGCNGGVRRKGKLPLMLGCRHFPVVLHPAGKPAARRGRGVHPLKAAVHIQLRRRSVADGQLRAEGCGCRQLLLLGLQPLPLAFGSLGQRQGAVQHSADLLDRHIQCAQHPDQLQGAHIRLRIDAILIFRVAGRGQQPGLLIIADIAGGHARLLRCLLDVHNITLLSLSPYTLHPLEGQYFFIK